MELKAYLTILRQRWYLVVLVPVLVLAGVIYQAANARPSYTASARLSVIRQSQDAPDTVFRYDKYYAYLSSEYLVDDLVELVRGNVFASDVAQTLARTQGVDVSPGEIQGAISSSRLNRILTVNVTSSDPERAVMIAQAAATTLEEHGARYFGFESPDEGAMISTVQRPDSAAANTQRQQMILALQILVGLFAGVLLAFLVDYLDDTLRTPDTVATALGLPVIGTIPNGKER